LGERQYIQCLQYRFAEFIGSFGSHGKGPGEFAQVPELNSVSYIQNNETIFQIFNTEKNIIQNINLNESLKNSKLAIFLEIKVPDDFVSKKPMYSKDQICMEAIKVS
jgi:hypothetical protein